MAINTVVPMPKASTNMYNRGILRKNYIRFARQC